ncbi:glycoside hydrolase superfamily [Terfezia claveryi]|nr:glycoside hydrolase superfamily [Terfezia claveryi]
MKYSFVALAATSIFGGALAAGHGHHHHRRHHNNMPRDPQDCALPEVPVPCTTVVTSYLVPVEHTYPSQTPVVQETSYVAPTIEATTYYTETTPTTVEVAYPSTTVVEIPHGEVPTPEVTICPTPGIYTIPDKTMTLTSTEYLCGKETTTLPPGIHTIGGVTTVVETQTTVTCPVAITETQDSTVTSKVVMTTYICPTPGTYTIAPITTTVTQTTVVPCEYPTVTSYEPGVYTRPEEVITITKTDEVYVCPTFKHVDVTQTVVPVPEETSTPYPTEETYPTKETSPTEETYQAKETYTPSPSKESRVVEETTSALVEIPEATTIPVSVPTNLPHGTSGPSWGITYSPYNDDQTCKSKDQVSSDIQSIAAAGFKNIRLYSSDCGSLDTVIPACETYQIKVIFGIFIRDTSCQADEDLERIMAWKKWEYVTMFVVGNEALFQGFCQPQQFADYITEVKNKLRGNGYEGPVTTTEPLNIIEQHYQVLCPALDVVSINCHPYFNPDVTADQAGPFLNTQLKRAEDLCGMTGYVLEAGWPNAGNTNGKAIASPDAQKTAFNSILSDCPTERICLFTWRNDKWKQPGGFNVEQNFGCGDLF